jgi:hypothetical protein
MSKYVLHQGCHRGTITSRDSSSSEHDTYEQAYQAYLDARDFYRSIGYQIWFAYIVAPDGTKTQLESNPYW